MTEEKTLKTPKPDNTADWIAYLDAKVEMAYHQAQMSLIAQRDASALKGFQVGGDEYSEIEKTRPQA